VWVDLSFINRFNDARKEKLFVFCSLFTLNPNETVFEFWIVGQSCLYSWQWIPNTFLTVRRFIFKRVIAYIGAGLILRHLRKSALKLVWAELYGRYVTTHMMKPTDKTGMSCYALSSFLRVLLSTHNLYDFRSTSYHHLILLLVVGRLWLSWPCINSYELNMLNNVSNSNKFKWFLHVCMPNIRTLFLLPLVISMC
jgi:hypothetical protein